MSKKEASKLSAAELRKRAIKEGGDAMERLRERAREFRSQGYFVPSGSGCGGHIHSFIPI